jgi:ankyrin repeat protein
MAYSSVTLFCLYPIDSFFKDWQGDLFLRQVSVTRKKEDQSKTDSYNHSYEPQQPAISLVQAVCSGDIEEVAGVFPGVISLEERDDQGGTPLIIADHKGYTNIVELLLDNGADIDAWEYNTGKTALIYAIEKDRFIKPLNYLF